MKIKTEPDSDDDFSLNMSKRYQIKIPDDDEKVSKSGGLKLGKVRLTQAEMDAIEGGERLQDVHMAAVNHLLQLQFPEKAGFQSTIYVSNGRAKTQIKGTVQIHFDQTMKHWVTSMCNESHVRLFDSLYFGRISDGIAKQLTVT